MAGAENLATEESSTKRAPAVASGIVGAPATHLPYLPHTPLQSVNAELALEAGISDPQIAKLCHIFTAPGGQLYDVEQGDILITSSGAEYTIRAVAEFSRGQDSYARLLLEQRIIDG